MNQKKTRRTRGKTATEKFSELLAEESKRQRAELLIWAESVKSLPAVERATEWLKRVAAASDANGDCEALVYLRSQGLPCEKEIAETAKIWKHRSEEQIKSYNGGTTIFSLDNTKRTRRIPRKEKIDSSDGISGVSVYTLRNFWIGTDDQELHLDGTMFRTVEWCEIGGFNGYWTRLANDFNEDVQRGGLEPLPASFLIFNYCRSNLAIEMLRPGLLRALDLLSLPTVGYRKKPWIFFWEDSKRRSEFRRHFIYIAQLAFVESRLRPSDPPSKLVLEALDDLIQGQNADGSWTCWENAGNASIESTAKAIHALALIKPRGWKLAVNNAAAWLLKQQHEFGYWNDAACPDLVYLTVLVLDALSLASDRSLTTFSEPKGVLLNPAADKPIKARFDVAFSFPGEHRKYIKTLVDLLIPVLGKEKIFYDQFFRAELAKPNSDIALQNYYNKESRLIVVLLCSDYTKKEWCGLEWRAIRELIKNKRDDQIMFLKKGTFSVPGTFSIDGYIDVDNVNTNEVCDDIVKRVRLLG